MGRFFKTALPNYVDNFVYQPPWEMAMKSLAVNEEGVKNSLAQAELFKNLDIKYINDPVERENVQKIQQYYTSKADELSQAIQKDPMNWRSKLPEITKFGRELQQDMTTGNISKIQGSYGAYQQWMKENDKMRTENPDLYNRLNEHWLGEWAKGNRSLDKMYRGEQIVAPINIADEKFQKIFKEFKANAWDEKRGGYWLEGKKVSEQDVNQAAYDLIMNEPSARGWFNQMGNILKDPGYYDQSTGKLRNVYELVDKQGNRITPEQAESLKAQYDKLTPEEKAKQGQPFARVLNPEHSMTPGIRAMGNIYGFEEGKYREDKFDLQGNKGKIDAAIQAQKDAAAFERLKYGKQADKDKLILNYKLKNEGDRIKHKEALALLAAKGGAEGEAAEKLLQTLEAKETIGIIPTPDITYGDNLVRVLNGDKTALSREQFARDSARKGLGYKQNSEEHKFLEYYDNQIQQGKSKDDIIADYVRSIKDVHLKNSYSLAQSKNIKNPYMATPGYIEGKVIANLRAKYGEVMDKYEAGKENYFTKYSDTSSKVSVHPLTLAGNNTVLGEINSNNGMYMAVDTNGNETGKPFVAKKIIGAVGGNSNGMIGYKIEDEDGNTTFVFPRNKYESTTQLNKNLIASNLNDPNSTLRKELIDSETNRVANFMNEAGINEETGNKAGVANIGGYNIPLEMTANGVIVRSPSGQVINTFKDLNSLVQFVMKNN